MYSNERKRFPQELFLPGFPARDNLTPGTKDSSIPLTTPVPGLTAASSFLNQIPIPHIRRGQAHHKSVPALFITAAFEGSADMADAELNQTILQNYILLIYIPSIYISLIRLFT
ncbi:hypothetical protein [Clostridium transplantifaecale]|uniref:hypothetical protein n=1 Tax=Clostridium transplantifaecale TaxID=2479838 RepID=UPI000F6301E6|nr:hypothetical protein [Clostridium transplantifaecale]